MPIQGAGYNGRTPESSFMVGGQGEPDSPRSYYLEPGSPMIAQSH